MRERKARSNSCVFSTKRVKGRAECPLLLKYGKCFTGLTIFVLRITFVLQIMKEENYVYN